MSQEPQGSELDAYDRALLKCYLVYLLDGNVKANPPHRKGKGLLQGYGLLDPGEAISNEDCQAIADARPRDLAKEIITLIETCGKKQLLESPSVVQAAQAIFAKIFKDCFAAIERITKDNTSLTNQERKNTLSETGRAFLLWLAKNPPYPECEADVRKYMRIAKGGKFEFLWPLRRSLTAGSSRTGVGDSLQTRDRDDVPGSPTSILPASTDSVNDGTATPSAQVRGRRTRACIP